jgi:hypothetical protein
MLVLEWGDGEVAEGSVNIEKGAKQAKLAANDSVEHSNEDLPGIQLA